MSNRHRWAGLGLAALVLCGCAIDRSRRDRYIQAHPDLPPAVRKAIADGKIALGMSTADAVAALGQPTQKVRSEDAKHGAMSLWIYDFSPPSDYAVMRPGLYPYYYYEETHRRTIKRGWKVWFKEGKVARFEEY